MENPLTNSSWKTTLIGILLGVITYFAQLGVNLPQTWHEFGVAIVAALLFALGVSAKDRNVSNALEPVPARVVVPKPEAVSPTMEHPVT